MTSSILENETRPVSTPRAGEPASPRPGLLAACVGEFLGTFLLVLFGLGAVHAGVLTGAFSGLWQVASIWGIGVCVAICATADLSGAHLNPAITAAMALFRSFPKRRIVPYVLAQTAGAIVAAAALHVIFFHAIERFESTHHLVRGQSGSELSAMIYGEYFPHPAMGGITTEAWSSLTLVQAMLAEGLGTALLALVVFMVTEPRNRHRPQGAFGGLWIGLGLAVIIAVLAPLTQAGFNPARDFGPRLFSYFAGWGAIAIPGPRGGFFTVYILAPIIGAVVGAGVYQYAVRRALPLPANSSLEP